MSECFFIMIFLAHPNNQNIFVLPTQLRVNIDRPSEGWGNFSLWVHNVSCNYNPEILHLVLISSFFSSSIVSNENSPISIPFNYVHVKRKTQDLLRLNGWYPFECYSTAVKMFPNCKLLPIYSFTEPRLGSSQVAYVLELRWSMRIQFDAPGRGTAHNN